MSLLNVSTCMHKLAQLSLRSFGLRHARVEGNLFHIQFPLWPEHPKELRYRKCLFFICESIVSD